MSKLCYNNLQEVPDFVSQLCPVNLLGMKPLNGIKVGLIRETLEDGVEAGVISSVRAAASHLENLGAAVTEVIYDSSHGHACLCNILFNG